MSLTKQYRTPGPNAGVSNSFNGVESVGSWYRALPAVCRSLAAAILPSRSSSTMSIGEFAPRCYQLLPVTAPGHGTVGPSLYKATPCAPGPAWTHVVCIWSAVFWSSAAGRRLFEVRGPPRSTPLRHAPVGPKLGSGCAQGCFSDEDQDYSYPLPEERNVPHFMLPFMRSSTIKHKLPSL